MPTRLGVGGIKPGVKLSDYCDKWNQQKTILVIPPDARVYNASDSKQNLDKSKAFSKRFMEGQVAALNLIDGAIVKVVDGEALNQEARQKLEQQRMLLRTIARYISPSYKNFDYSIGSLDYLGEKYRGDFFVFADMVAPLGACGSFVGQIIVGCVTSGAATAALSGAYIVVMVPGTDDISNPQMTYMMGDPATGNILQYKQGFPNPCKDFSSDKALFNLGQVTGSVLLEKVCRKKCANCGNK
jgi:hypothetical protein